MPQFDKTVLFAIALSSLFLNTALYMILSMTIFLPLFNIFKLVVRQSNLKLFKGRQTKKISGALSRFFWIAI